MTLTENLPSPCRVPFLHADGEMTDACISSLHHLLNENGFPELTLSDLHILLRLERETYVEHLQERRARIHEPTRRVRLWVERVYDSFPENNRIKAGANAISSRMNAWAFMWREEEEEGEADTR